MQSIEDLWEALLSREVEQIRRAFEGLAEAEQQAVLAHLRRMAGEPGWHPEQVKSAQAAIAATAALLRHALASQTQALAGLSIWRDSHFHGPVECRHADSGPKRGLPRCDRQVGLNVPFIKNLEKGYDPTDRFAALNATRELREAFEKLDPVFLARPLAVTCKTSYATDGSQISPSTVGREIMYSVAHAVHHYALIGIMGGLMGLTMPSGFGVAPSTMKHQADVANAGRS